MHEGTWTISPCPHRVQAELASSLGVSEVTAGVLVRRGYGGPAAARAFLAGEGPPHDPFRVGGVHEGYGVRWETLGRLADEACGLVLTVDCGITAVAEVAEARARGLDVIVTDHHRPGETLPDCPIVATRPSTYPFPELCGTGVVYKLGQALFGVDSDV